MLERFIFMFLNCTFKKKIGFIIVLYLMFAPLHQSKLLACVSLLDNEPNSDSEFMGNMLGHDFKLQKNIIDFSNTVV